MSAVEMSRRLLDGNLTSIGLTSSAGALNPPLFIYLLAIPLAVSDGVLVATAFIGIWAAVAIGLTYRMLLPRFGAITALGAAALFATGPWAVLYGRKIWAQDLTPIFTVLLLWSLFAVLDRPRSRAIVAVPVLLCLVFQLNFSAAALFVPVVGVLAYRARELSPRGLLLGVTLALLLIAPWLGYEARHGFDDVGLLVTEGRGHSGTTTLGAGSVAAARRTLEILGAGDWTYVTGPSEAMFAATAGRAWTWAQAATGLATGLLVVAFASSLIQGIRGARRIARWPYLAFDVSAARRLVLIGWIVGIWLSYVTSATERVFPHYLIMTYPVSFVLVALGAQDLVAIARLGLDARLVLPAKIVAVSLLVVIAASFAVFTVSFHNYLDRYRGTAGDYGLVYDDINALAEALRSRGLRADDQVVNFLALRRTDLSLTGSGVVAVRNTLRTRRPSPVPERLRSFGAYRACFPRDGG